MVGDILTAANMSIISGDLTFLYGDSYWTAPTLGNGWVPSGGGTNGVAFMKAGRFVYLRGVINGTTIGTVAFTLPAGYSPIAITPLATTANDAFAVLYVSGAGAVQPQIGSVTSFSLEGLFWSYV